MIPKTRSHRIKNYSTTAKQTSMYSSFRPMKTILTRFSQRSELKNTKKQEDLIEKLR